MPVTPRLLTMTVLLVCAARANAQGVGNAPLFRPMGFGDLSYVVSNADVAEGFLVGQLVGQLTAALSDRLTVFTEVSATARSDNYTFDVERLLLRYDFTDIFKLSAGRYHNPISYWNTAFHHGLWLQTTTARPEMIRFGNRLIPVHFVGLLAEGVVQPGTLGLNYAVGIGNGRGANISRAGDAGDVDGERAATVALFWRPPRWDGLRIGASAYIDRIPARFEEPRLRERILAAHVAWTPGDRELIAEYARISHARDGARASFVHSHAYYVQASWRLHGRAAALRPYGRFEAIEMAETSSFTPLSGDYRAVIGGLRYDFDLLASLRAEYRRERARTDDYTGTFVVQASFALAPQSGPAM